MKIHEDSLKDFILDLGLLKEIELEIAEKERKEKNITITEHLLNKGLLNKDEIRRLNAYALAIPFIDLKNKNLPYNVVSLIPEPISRERNVIALNKSDEVLEVAMLDISDLSSLDFLKDKHKVKILPRLTDEESIKSSLRRYQKLLSQEFGDIIKKESDVIKSIFQSSGKELSEERLRMIAENLSVIRILETLLKHSLLKGASDVHIEPTEENVLIRYRINGTLYDSILLPKYIEYGINSRIKTLSKLNLKEKNSLQEGKFKIEKDREKISFNVSILPTYLGEKIVLSISKTSSFSFSLESIGFQGNNLEILKKSINSKEGTILISGHSGSGKTTTLYTMLDMLNLPSVNISTIEDSIEHRMPRINQIQISEEKNVTPKSSLRSLSKQDTDIVMVDEIKDKEEIFLSLKLALTGNLVLSSIESKDSFSALSKIVNMKVDPGLISTIKVIVGQKLVNKLGPKKKKYFISEKERNELKKIADLDKVLEVLIEEKVVSKNSHWDEIPFYKFSDSVREEERYDGKITINEILRISPSIKELILKGSKQKEIQEQARKEGMLTMIEDGIFKVVQGLTTLEEVLNNEKK